MLPALLLSFFAAGVGASYAALAQPSTGLSETDSAAQFPAAGAALSSERLRAIQESARAIAEQALQAAAQGKERFRDFGQQAQRRADDIADAALAQGRREVLDFLGLDAESNSSLYYFVSFNMPLPMLRAYATEAMWAGGTLVVRGVPPGKTLGEFVLENLQDLVYDKGASANLSIDPRLFDAYGVKVVPAIVLSTERKNFECQGVNPVSFTYQGQALSYDTCPPVDPDKYWKMTGAVTSDYALREFADVGAQPARAHLAALAKGMATGARAPKAQQPFEGDWKAAITPEEMMAAQRAVQAAQAASSSQSGTPQ